MVAARAAWDTMSEIEDEWEAFRASLKVMTNILSADLARRLEDILIDLTRKQSDLLIHGIVNGTASTNIVKLSGMAYLSGSDTWYFHVYKLQICVQ